MRPTLFASHIIVVPPGQMRVDAVVSRGNGADGVCEHDASSIAAARIVAVRPARSALDGEVIASTVTA